MATDKELARMNWPSRYTDLMARLGEPDHPRGYRSSTITKRLTPEQDSHLNRWLRGQTCGVDEATGECVVYASDLRRWAAGFGDAEWDGRPAPSAYTTQARETTPNEPARGVQVSHDSRGVPGSC